MKKNISDHFEETLFHLYINPLEKCNLRCKICYTKKTNPILAEAEILEFIGRYRQIHPLEVVTFCGGEVFTLPYFTGMVNMLTTYCHSERNEVKLRNLPNYGRWKIPPFIHYRGIGRDDRNASLFVQIITNGTVDKLEEIENPNMVNLIVSIDGLKDYHDENRGAGNFDKTLNFLKKAIRLGFHTEIFSVVTKQNYDRIPEFEDFIHNELGLIVRGSRNKFGMTPIKIGVTFHPRKPPSYLLHHPVSNIEGQVTGFDYLSEEQMIKLMKEKKTFPPKELGCYQIALVSNGDVYGCCEGTVPLGKMDDKIEMLIGKLKERLEIWEKDNKIKGCLGCSQPDFVCGIMKYINK